MIACFLVYSFDLIRKTLYLVITHNDNFQILPREQYFMHKENFGVDRVLDLRGRQCPMTFVYTTVALEEMHVGEILQVILDFRSAFSNVPKSVIKQGLGEILNEDEKEGIKTLWIKKI